MFGAYFSEAIVGGAIDTGAIVGVANVASPEHLSPKQLKSLFPKRVKSTFGTSEKNRFLWQNLYTCLWEIKI